jgi:hypothetical protein
VRKKQNRETNNFWNKIVNNLTSEEKNKIVKFYAPSEKCRFCLIKNAKWINNLLKEYACDECIPRGCSCRLKKRTDRTGLHIEDYDYDLDKHGREKPCEDWKKI